MTRQWYSVLGVLFLAFMAAPGTAAQTRVGVIGGINLSDMHLDVDEEIWQIERQTVIGLGGLVDFTLSPHLALRVEPMFLQKRGYDKTGVEAELKLAYLELPLLLTASIGSSVRPYLLCGPTFGYLISSEIEIDLGTVLIETGIQELIRRIDWGITAGCGVVYPARRCSILVEGRYTWGISNIGKAGIIQVVSGDFTTDLELVEDDVIRNKGLQIMIGFLLPVGR